MQQRSFKYIGSRVLQVVALPVCLRPFFNLCQKTPQFCFIQATF